MILGIGVDIVEIQRIAQAAEKPSFLRKVFAPEEEAGQHKPQSLAVRFAAKEAVSKALGTGFSGFSPHEILILKGEKGRPFVRLTGCALAVADGLGVKGWQLSLSHSKDNAIAFVIAVGRDEDAFN